MPGVLKNGPNCTTIDVFGVGKGRWEQHSAGQAASGCRWEPAAECCDRLPFLSVKVSGRTGAVHLFSNQHSMECAMGMRLFRNDFVIHQHDDDEMMFG